MIHFFSHTEIRGKISGKISAETDRNMTNILKRKIAYSAFTNITLTSDI